MQLREHLEGRAEDLAEFGEFLAVSGDVEDVLETGQQPLDPAASDYVGDLPDEGARLEGRCGGEDRLLDVLRVQAG